MKLGADNRIKTGIAIALMVVSAVAAVRGFGGYGSTAPTSPESTAEAATPSAQVRRTAPASSRRTATAPVLAQTLDPRLRLDLLQVAEHTTYDGGGRNIFRAETEPAPIPQPVKSPILNPGPPQPTPPPPPPPISLRLFGFANRPGEPKKVFLADGDEVFVVGEGEVVERRYKVVHIGVNSVEIQDVLNNNVQTIPLTQV